jgi:hypothetical protein
MKVAASLLITHVAGFEPESVSKLAFGASVAAFVSAGEAIFQPAPSPASAVDAES